MKLSKKLKGKIKRGALITASTLTVVATILVADSAINTSNSLIAKIQSNIKSAEATEIASK